MGFLGVIYCLKCPMGRKRNIKYSKACQGKTRFCSKKGFTNALFVLSRNPEEFSRKGGIKKKYE
jgi:hypothetical protein